MHATSLVAASSAERLRQRVDRAEFLLGRGGGYVFAATVTTG
jgi:hypothetical protein